MLTVMERNGQVQKQAKGYKKCQVQRQGQGYKKCVTPEMKGSIKNNVDRRFRYLLTVTETVRFRNIGKGLS